MVLVIGYDNNRLISWIILIKKKISYILISWIILNFFFLKGYYGTSNQPCLVIKNFFIFYIIFIFFKM